MDASSDSDPDWSEPGPSKRTSRVKSGKRGGKRGKTSSSTSESNMTESVNCEYLTDIRQTMERFDVTKEGKIEVKQLKFAMRALGFEPKKEEIKRISEEHAKNGFISMQDFEDLMVKRFTEKNVNEEIMKAFQLFDSGHTGKITFDDLKRVADELGEKITDDELCEMIEEADLDGDKAVDCQEFLRIMKKTCLY